MTAGNASLGSLPDELILEVLLYLNTIRSSETQSTAFKQKEKEKARQRENRNRQRTLWSLCLTSRCLKRLATPFLYASFTGSATWYGIEPLRLFHKTITTTGVFPDQGYIYAQHTQYVETRLSDYLGNNLYADTALPDAIHMVARYFCLLAEIVKCAPNLQHLSVTSLETSDVSFWRYLLPEEDSTSLSSSAITNHNFNNLQTLCVQTHVRGFGSGTRAVSFSSICEAIASAPLLSDFRASSVMTTGLSGPELGSESFKSLQRLEITECVVDIDSVASVLSVCEGLRNILCSWAYLDTVGETPSDLSPGLLRHSDTLETLYLDFREVRCDPEITTSQCLGSLRQFKQLKALTISQKGFLGEDWPEPDITDWSTRNRIVELLPLELKSFTILVDADDYEREWETLDDLFDMWTLSEACRSSALNLTSVNIKLDSGRHEAIGLMEAFSQAGVGFKVITER